MDELGRDMTPTPEETAPDFSLDDILQEFSDENLVVDEDIADDDVRSVELEPEGDNIAAAEISTADEPKPAPAEEKPVQKPVEDAPHTVSTTIDEGKTDYDIVNEYKPVGSADLDELLKDVDLGFITDNDAAPGEYASAEEEFDAEPEPETERRQVAPQPVEDEPEDIPLKPEKPERSFGERVATPFVAAMAVISMKRQQRRTTVKAAPPEEAEDLGAEMDADKASRYYGSHIRDLRLRTRISAGLCLVLMYISFGLPVAGRLHNTAVCSLMCLILMLAVMVVCLDVFTAGIMSLVRKRPGASSLIAISCVLSAADAVIIVLTGNKDLGLPFCAVSALSITAALWSSLLQCKGNRMTLRTLALSKEPIAVTAESGISDDDITLVKSKSDTENFVRRTEEMTPDEEAYSTLAPWLVAGAVALALIAAVAGHNFKSIIHILAAIFMPAAPLSALLAFPLPYASVARRLFHSGSAIAGWSGLCDVGGSKHIIITDRDIFPKDTVAIESIRVLEGMSPDKIISYTGSVIAASGSGLAPVFTELMKKNGCVMEQVDEFCCHEGGGLTAMINGEEVLCGNSGFMRLMGIRLPQKLASKTSVFVSVNGMISAIFTIAYTPVVTVQKALISLLHSRRKAIFAIRDFNVTPEMIRHKFKIPTEGFDFPSFAKRYEISSAHRSGDSKIAAMVSRDGLLPLVELSEQGHRLYTVVRLSVLLSVLCSVIGMVLMFFLCLTGAFDSVTVGNIMFYLLVWLLPELALVFGMNR